MRYGFKARAERMAAEARTELGIKANAPFDTMRYAALRGIVMLDYDQLPLAAAAKRHLITSGASSWSGMTIREGKTWAIVLNPTHPTGRQNNTLMHEISHIVLDHVPAQVNVSVTGLMVLSDFSNDQEDEADWLSGTMLLSRDALYEKRMKVRTVAQIAADMGVSAELVTWRLRMTGVDVQIKRTRLAKENQG